jgi:multidrug efflux pump subunit AcrA (membrane-fusion protein)
MASGLRAQVRDNRYPHKDSQGNTIIHAPTEPSKRRAMHFPFPGIVRTVFVKEHDAISKGQPLMEQDNDIEKDEYERARLEAETTSRIEYVEADLAYKQVNLKRKESVGTGSGVYSELELQEAKLAVIQSEKQLEVTKLDKRGNEIKAQQQKTRLDKMRLHSDLNGYVESINIWESELATLDPDKPAIIVVQTDPCHVVISDLSALQVTKLQPGEEMEVRFKDEQEWRKAKVLSISPVADPTTSGWQEVKLELPNPDKRAPGQWVEVKLPAKLLPAVADNSR